MRIIMAIVFGGLSAGLMDFCAAMTMNRLPALTIGRAVASGVYGKGALWATRSAGRASGCISA